MQEPKDKKRRELDASAGPAGGDKPREIAGAVVSAPRLYLTEEDDPILASLWNNDYDAIYDNL